MKKLFKGLGATLATFFIFFNVIVAFHAYKFTHFYDNPTGLARRYELMSGGTQQKLFCLVLILTSLKLPVSHIFLIKRFMLKQTMAFY